ncbi:hypothetical protein IG631_19205 [Alternaria alternata]|nr:hypothetical protein IG631_19205 [Alternaria alternata]
MWVKTEGGRAERHSNGVRREKRGARWCQARQALITLVGPGGDHRRPERAHHHRSSKQASSLSESCCPALAADCPAANGQLGKSSTSALVRARGRAHARGYPHNVSP